MDSEVQLYVWKAISAEIRIRYLYEINNYIDMTWLKCLGYLYLKCVYTSGGNEMNYMALYV